MPLDHLVTVTHTPPGHRNEFGEWVLGVPVPYRVWATIEDSGSTDEETADGTRIAAIKSFTFRWVSVLARVPISELTVLDEYGTLWDAEDVRTNEERGRRRFLAIEAVRVEAQ